MEAQTKVAKQRLSVLELAEKLGNVSEACRRRGMDRASFYEWKRRFQTHGLEGLKDLPPIAKTHPQAVAAEVQERIVALALEHPSYGCNKIEKLNSLEGPYISNVTIQKILIEHGLGSRYERWLALEKKSAEEGIELSGDQITYIEKLNPSFKERHVESSGPGELLSQDTFFVGARRYAVPRPMASWSGSTARCSTSSTGSYSGRSCTRRLKRCRRTWTSGCMSTIMRDRTWAIVTKEGGPGKRSSCIYRTMILCRL